MGTGDVVKSEENGEWPIISMKNFGECTMLFQGLKIMMYISTVIMIFARARVHFLIAGLT